MPNFNLKFLIIGVISLSIFIILGAFMFSFLNKSSPSPQQPSEGEKQIIQAPPRPAGGGPGGDGGGEVIPPPNSP